VDLQESAARVVRAVEQELELQLIDALRQIVQAGRCLGGRRRVSLLLRQLGQNVQIVGARLGLGDRIEPALQRAEPAVDSGRRGPILPEIAAALLRLEPPSLRQEGRDVKAPPSGPPNGPAARPGVPVSPS
jgi:hypothetical protein